MAGNLAVVQQAQGRFLCTAQLGRIGAALVEGAARRRVQRVGQLADDFDFRLVRVRVDGRCGRQQRLGIGVQRAGVDLLLGPHFYRAAEVHHQDLIGDMPDHRQVVGDEHVGGVEFLLQIHEQVEHLCLNRYVEGGGRFVGHQHLGLQHHGARQGDPLALATREHVRVAMVMLRAQTHLLHHRLHFIAAFAGAQAGVDQ